MNDDLKRVEEKIREEFPPEKYELLVNFAAKLLIEGSIMKNERQDFFNAMFAIELARGDYNKEAEEYVKEVFKKNSLFKAFMRLDSYKIKFHSWYMQRKRHKNDKEAKKQVLDWWKVDKEQGKAKTDMIQGYQNKLLAQNIYPVGNNKSKKEQREPDEEKKYTFEAISGWLTNK